MRYFLLSICLYLAVTWTVDITVAIEQEKHAPPNSAFTNDNSEVTLPDRNGNKLVDNGNTQYLSKRVPSGFFGLRGKKSFEGWVSSQEDDEIYNKGAPTGFFGLRGKKDMDYAMDFEKRVPSGFLGLRGKKFYDYMGLDDDEFPYHPASSAVAVNANTKMRSKTIREPPPRTGSSECVERRCPLETDSLD
ncbi:hypothetical protein Trydic_g3588 [Trypoxylus dichotomus]